MKKELKDRIKQVLQHIFFWIFVLLLYSSIFNVDNTLDSQVVYFSLFLMPVTIATTYISIYKLIPDYLVTKQYIRFSLYSIYTLIISVFAICLSIFFALAYLTDFKFEKINAIGKSALFIATSIYLIVIVVSAFKLLKLNLKQSKSNAILEAKFLESQLKLKEQELKYLKMQIHPHFLFNTLNTMYGFALKKAEETPEMILKLSNLLDYLLYQVDKPFVSLDDEIHLIEDYISLEEMRFNDTLKVNFNKHISAPDIEVSPMLFIPFVENSFKHGSITNGLLQIHISINANADVIDFSIHNSHTKNVQTNEGIGLENIKKRLELLYPNRYTLDATEGESKFEVRLQLYLND